MTCTPSCGSTGMKSSRLSHLDTRGQARMVDIGSKDETARDAVARGFVTLQPDTLRLIQDQAIPKGDVYAAARLAGILAAKRVHEIIPLCHPLLITAAEVEALAAVSVAALTIYDMCKAIDKQMVIGDVRLVLKAGGRSGTYRRPR